MNIVRLYLGSLQISKIFHGTTLIWPAISDNAYYGYVYDELIFRQLALMSYATGESVTVVYDETFMQNGTAVPAFATITCTNDKALINPALTPDAFPVQKGEVSFRELFSVAGLNPEAKIGVDTISYDDLLFATKAISKQADTSKAAAKDTVCIVSNFDVTNTRVLEAFVDKQEIIRYKAIAHNYIEAHGEAKYQIVLMSNVLGGTADLHEAGSVDTLVFVPEITCNSILAQLAAADMNEVLRLAGEPASGHSSIATVLLSALMKYNALAKSGIGFSTESTLELESVITADTYIGTGSIGESHLKHKSTYVVDADSGVGSVSASDIELHTMILADALSIGLTFTAVKLKMLLTQVAEADALNIVEACSSMLEKMLYKVEATTGMSQPASVSERQIHVYSATADFGTGTVAKVLTEFISSLVAIPTPGIGQDSTIDNTATMLHSAIATSLFVWLYPVWETDDTLYIRCGHPVTQEGDTVIFGEVT